MATNSQKSDSIPFEDQEIIYDCHEAIVARELRERANALCMRIGHKLSGYKQREEGLYDSLPYCVHCGKVLSQSDFGQRRFCTFKIL